MYFIMVNEEEGQFQQDPLQQDQIKVHSEIYYYYI